MMDHAARNDDEYGLWQSQRYIATLYLRQNDIYSARKYLRSVVDTWGKSSDSRIRRQSMTRPYCDLADTYHRGSDSARFYYNKAEETALTGPDTLRIIFYKAQLAALDGQFDKYKAYRDFCLGDDSFRVAFTGGAQTFRCIDALLADKPLNEFTAEASRVGVRQQMIYLRDLAISRNRQDVAAWLGTNIISTLYADINRLNRLKIEETSAMMNDSQMKMMASRQKRVQTWLWIAVGLLAAGLAAAIAALKTEKNKNKTIK